MRYGFTTGTCAAAASKAAAYMLLTGKSKNRIRIETPKGIDFEAEPVLTAPKTTEVSEEERQTVADMMRRLGL